MKKKEQLKKSAQEIEKSMGLWSNKLDAWTKMDLQILEEFGWNVADMATEIRDLREKNKNNHS